MTERLADISARIEGISQLGSVVNAMRGIAAARAQQANSQLPAADSHAATIAAAISQVLALLPATLPAQPSRMTGRSRTALVVFCAEQGFVGAFSDKVLDSIAADLPAASMFVIGTRGLANVAERSIVPIWSASMPAHTRGIPRLADRIAEAVYDSVVSGDIEALDVVYSLRRPGQLIEVQRRRLFPIDPVAFPRGTNNNPPLLTLAPEELLRDLTAEYLFAQLCAIALHAFAAENAARMEAMAQARSQIDRQLIRLRSTLRRVRQEEITAEIIELAAGSENTAWGQVG